MVNFKNMFFIIFFFGFFSYQAKARVVSDITIKSLGVRAEGRTDETEAVACKVYKPTKKQLTRFFKLAEESKERGTLLHEYYSPCVSFGTVKFKDGASGSWTIQSSGLGTVIFDNKDVTTFFLKDNKWTDPYACTYGMSDEIEC